MIHTGEFCVGENCRELWEKAMATHSSTLAWKIPWTEDAVHGVAELDTAE